MTILLLTTLLVSNCNQVNLSNFAGRMGSRYAVSFSGSVQTTGTSNSQVFSKAMAGWDPCSGMAKSSDPSKALHFNVIFHNDKPKPDNKGNLVLGDAKAWTSLIWTASDGSYSMEFASQVRINIWTQDKDGNELSEADLVGILMHELGHGFGLNHAPSTCNTAIMYEEALPSTVTGRTYVIAANPLPSECDEVKKIDNDDPWDETKGTLKAGHISGGVDSGGSGSTGGSGGGGIQGNLCSGVSCPSGHVCDNGACIPANGCVIPCPPGYTCSYGVCIAVLLGDPDCFPPFDCDDTMYKARTGHNGNSFVSLGRGLMLALDMDHDDKLRGRREVFRGHIDVFTGETLTPWEALARFDDPHFGGNGDGVLDSLDLVWNHLRVHDMGRRLKLSKHPQEIGLDVIELP